LNGNKRPRLQPSGTNLRLGNYHEAKGCPTAERGRPLHSFRARCSGARLSQEQARSLTVTRQMLDKHRGERGAPRHTNCPAPLPRPMQHNPFPRDPRFVRVGAGLVHQGTAGHEAHPNPLVVAQAFSLLPEAAGFPRVDWLAAKNERTSRRAPPGDPWRTVWSPDHNSLLIPRATDALAALTKFQRDGGQGIVFLADDAPTRAHTLAHEPAEGPEPRG
jgi:hypothetical protein